MRWKTMTKVESVMMEEQKMRTGKTGKRFAVIH